MRTRLSSSRAGLLLLLVTLASCGGSDIVAPGDESANDPSQEDSTDADPPDGATVSFVDDVHVLFVAKGCTAGSCHGGGAGELTLTASASENYQSLVGVASTCPPLLLVEVNDAAQSYLVQKLEGTHGCGGSRMPVGSGSLTQSEIATVRSWIDAGAPDN